MTFVQAPLEKTSDDMSVEILLLVSVAVTTPIIIHTGNSEMYAIPGAILAAVVALLKAVSEKRTWSEKGIVIIGTTVVGSTVPVVIMHWRWPDMIHRVIPHMHLIFGFLSGLIGWLLFWAGYLILDRRKENVAKAAIKEVERRLGIPPTHQDQDPQP